jgi:hypothetical protein
MNSITPAILMIRMIIAWDIAQRDRARTLT